MKNHLKILLPCLLAALALLCFAPHEASAQEGLSASKACAGHTLGAVNGCPACMEEENLHICENNFPDANFRGYLVDELFGSDSVPIEQVNNQTEVYCHTREIASMKGVEYFGALEALECYSNQLTSLDVSQNPALYYLSCDFNQLTSLDVSQNPALNWLRCSSNQLTSLDVSQNPALRYLDCDSNQLTSLDVSKNIALEELWCCSNQLTSLDLSNNPDLLSGEYYGISYNDVGNQMVQCSAPITGQIDLASIVGQENLRRVVSVEGGSYDPATGIVSLEEGVTEFTYYYDTQNEAAGNMQVDVTVIPYIPGDINGDGKVNIFDVIRLLKKVTGEDVKTFANTDVNHDGKVNIFDVIRLLKYVTGEQVEVH